jgi:hypothetical protein
MNCWCMRCGGCKEEWVGGGMEWSCREGFLSGLGARVPKLCQPAKLMSHLGTGSVTQALVESQLIRLLVFPGERYLFPAAILAHELQKTPTKPLPSMHEHSALDVDDTVKPRLLDSCTLPRTPTTP